MQPKQIKTLFERLKAQNPHPTTELQFASHFELLVAVMLSAQATDVSVNQATQHLFPVANTPEGILELGLKKLESYIKRIGLYHTKARHILKMCAQLIQHHQGKVPNDRAALEALPGVGRKTANVILNTAFKQPTIAVDTHIFRVSNRTGLAVGKTPLEVERKLLQVVPARFKQDAHHWLILHGRYVCKARKPQCSHCVLVDVCEYDLKNIE